jgi:hypothetical protein
VSNGLGYEPGPMGWVVPGATTFQEMLDAEKRYYDRAWQDYPLAYQSRPARDMMPAIKAKWEKFQADRGRFPGSQDLTLIDEFVFGKSFTWYPQLIGSCFPAGTLIRMADGSQKPIEQVRLFEQVLTAEGNISHISQIGGREVDEDIFEIKAWGHIKVRMTGEHPILTRRGYVKASELSMSDYIAVPKYAPMQAEYLHTASHYFATMTVARTARKLPVSTHRTFGGSVKVYRQIPEVIPMTEDFGWLCGLYLAEGGSDKTKLTWTMHAKEMDTHVAKLSRLFKEMFDIDLSIVVKSARPNTCKVVLNSTIWARMFESLFGQGSGSKRLHGDIASGNESFLRGLLQGWLDGDGHRRESVDKGDGGLWDGVSISKSLALDMFNIANALGMLPTIQACDPKASHGVKSRKRRYDVVIRDNKQPMQAIVEDGTVWRQVRSIEKVPFAGKVYNFEVPGDNSYVADGLGVHNCVWSNTFRRWFERMCVEICLLGDPEEFIGKTELGPTSLAPFCVSYGFARQRANMRGGDGLYCKPMAESLVKDGVVLCNTPKLKELMDKAGVSGEQNYPEVQPERLYRQIGDWAWNEALRPYTTCRLLEAPMVTTMDQANRNIDELKPMFVCSSVAIRKAGRHPDGFDIHTRDRGDIWAHNMGIAGRRVASDGERFVIWCNTSWLRRGTSNVEAYIYNMKESEFDGLLRSGQLDVSTIGDIDGIKSLPSNF